MATLVMLQSPATDKRIFPRGPLFGRLFARILRGISTSYKGRRQFRRYNHYDPRDIPDEETWENTVHLRVHSIINFWKDYENKPNKQICICAMKKFTADLARTNDGTGCLASNHATLLMGMLGLLPSWTIDFAVITPKAKPIDWINKNIPMEKPLKGTELDRFVASLARSLQAICPKLKFSLRIMENVLCEVYRHFSAQLRGRVTFNDTLTPDQWVFVYNGLCMMFVSRDGSRGDLGAAILGKIPYGEQLLTMSEIVRACQVHDFSRRVSSLPRELTHPRSRFAFDFDPPQIQQLPTDYVRQQLSAVRRSC